MTQLDLQDLLRGIEFDSVIPGDYGLALPKSGVRALSTRYSAAMPITQNAQPESADLDCLESYNPQKSAMPKSMPRALSGMRGIQKNILPANIKKLEHILSLAYQNKIRITRIRDLPVTRKEVREVHFFLNNKISKVWVFKADPKTTSQELNTYYLVHSQGVPTAKPIGYTPSKKPYQADIAILGGIVEDAGGSYNELIETMPLTPDIIHNVAQKVSKIIADYHVKLTLVKKQFIELGIELKKASPKRELEERLFAAREVQNPEILIHACESLYQKQSGLQVVSHGDIHTGNIVTISEIDELTRLASTSTNKFGIIDWGSIMTDTPLGDLQDYWVHHKRLAQKVCQGNYIYDFDSIASTYQTEFEKKASEAGLDMEVRFSRKDTLIQSALWNLYEMYDPVRKNKQDIWDKAQLHYESLIGDLEKLKKYSDCVAYAEQIAKEVSKILKE